MSDQGSSRNFPKIGSSIKEPRQPRSGTFWTRGRGWTLKDKKFLFLQTRSKTKGQTSNPGILCLDWMYEMLFHKFNKTEDEATYLCRHRKHPTFACKAKLRVVKEDNFERWIISTPHEDIKHSCDPNEAEIIAKLLKEDMKDIVRKDPATAVTRAIETVIQQAEDNYGENEDFMDKITAELGTTKGLLEMLYAVRIETVGVSPKSRDDFKPEAFLDKHFEKENVVVLDSDKLSNNWEDKINRINLKTKYRWDKESEEMRNYEEEGNENEEANTMEEDNVEETTDNKKGKDDGSTNNSKNNPPESEQKKTDNKKVKLCQ